MRLNQSYREVYAVKLFSRRILTERSPNSKRNRKQDGGKFALFKASINLTFTMTLDHRNTALMSYSLSVTLQHLCVVADAKRNDLVLYGEQLMSKLLRRSKMFKRCVWKVSLNCNLLFFFILKSEYLQDLKVDVHSHSNNLSSVESCRFNI